MAEIARSMSSRVCAAIVTTTAVPMGGGVVTIIVDDLVTRTGTATTLHAVTTTMDIPVIVIDTTITVIPTITVDLDIIADLVQGSILVGRGRSIPIVVSSELIAQSFFLLRASRFLKHEEREGIGHRIVFWWIRHRFF